MVRLPVCEDPDPQVAGRGGEVAPPVIMSVPFEGELLSMARADPTLCHSAIDEIEQRHHRLEEGFQLSRGLPI